MLRCISWVMKPCKPVKYTQPSIYAYNEQIYTKLNKKVPYK